MSNPEPQSPFAPRLPAGPGDRLRWSGLYGSSQGLVIARAAEEHAGPVLAITPDTPAARRLEEEIRFFLPRDDATPLLRFPDWETLPYDLFSPHQDIVSERLATLRRLPTAKRGILVVPVATMMVRLCPRAYLEANRLSIAVGETMVIDEFRRRLETGGYRAVGQVMEHGEFAVRGSLLDLYPMGSDLPLRIDLLDDEVDSIRRFDPETQRSVGPVDAIDTLPAREHPMTDEAITRFRGAWRARFEGDPTRCPVYRAVSDGLAPAGIEYYLPLFFDATSSLLDYLPDTCIAVMPRTVSAAADAFWEEIGQRHEEYGHDGERPLLPPAEVFLPPGELFEAVGRMGRVTIGNFEGRAERGYVDYGTRAPSALPVDGRAEDPLAFVKQFVADFEGRILFLTETAGRQETLLETFAGHGLRPRRCSGWAAFLGGEEPVAITVSPIESGLIIEDPPVALITESQLFGERAMQRRRRKTTRRDEEAIIRELAELSVGAAVVHERYGVGRYLGLESLTVGGQTNEFLALEYADGDRLYVPVLALHLISRYSGADPDHAPLHKLGTGQWLKARKKAAERVRDVAAELLEIQARRAARPGHAFALDHDEYRTFVQAFPFEETPDQQTTIEAVLDDLTRDKAMDRLVCGDVGFGKTEVAMRAAFTVVQDGWQVAVLVPTTLLAQQHHRNFSDRFADWPVKVEQLSRFRSKRQRDEVIGQLADGRVDIVIGTHKLLQDDIHFKRLGLVIIDEEHRFGVRQKERLKALRAEVDVLTLTATPIPRTLNMALSELRDLSLIGTPPDRRLSIKTFVREWNGTLLREACLREIRRGGQIYLVHNRVEDIEWISDEIQRLVPEAETRIAHGQMRERDLEQVMLDFYRGRFNLLVCTTIIETGIDVPNANTIIINRADRFGLAQLHQLRGRVGRSHHRAYAYLVVPQRNAMTADAIKRLEAIEALEDLGIGFSLATHDLEIRGAGELLGDEQSGQIHEVGYALYTRLLERTVAALRSGRSPELDRPLEHGAEIDLRVPTLIPGDYLPDVHTRLIMYKRIASAATRDQLRELQVEMIDRFGLLPDATKALFRITELKLAANPLGVRKIDIGARGGRLTFHESPDIDPARVIRLIQSQPQSYRLDGADKLRITMELPDLDSRIAAVGDLLAALTARDAA